MFSGTGKRGGRVIHDLLVGTWKTGRSGMGKIERRKEEMFSVVLRLRFVCMDGWIYPLSVGSDTPPSISMILHLSTCRCVSQNGCFSCCVCM